MTRYFDDGFRPHKALIDNTSADLRGFLNLACRLLQNISLQLRTVLLGSRFGVIQQTKQRRW